MTHSITVYTKPDCVQCDRTFFLLNRADRDFEKFDVTEDEAAMSYVKNLGYLAAPVVVLTDVNGEVTDHWSGFRPDLLGKYL